MSLETSGKIVDRFHNSGVQRPLARPQKPRNGADFAISAEADAETGLVGWRRSLNRTGLHHQFPANREFYREFRKIVDTDAPEIPTSGVGAGRYTRFPHSTKQGIISAEQGILAQKQGISPTKTEIIAG
jgi:hypothetical protein